MRRSGGFSRISSRLSTSASLTGRSRRRRSLRACPSSRVRGGFAVVEGDAEARAVEPQGEVPVLGVGQGVHGVDQDRLDARAALLQGVGQDGHAEGQALPRARARGHHEALPPQGGPQGLLLVDVGVEGGLVLEVLGVAPQEGADLRGQEALPDEGVHALPQAVAPFLGHEGLPPEEVFLLNPPAQEVGDPGVPGLHEALGVAPEAFLDALKLGEGVAVGAPALKEASESPSRAETQVLRASGMVARPSRRESSSGGSPRVRRGEKRASRASGLASGTPDQSRASPCTRRGRTWANQRSGRRWSGWSFQGMF